MKLRTKAGVAVAALAVLVGGVTIGWAAASSGDPNHAAIPQVVRPSVVNPIDTSTEAKYTALTPCRIVDTRVAGGLLAAGATRAFQVTGTSGFTGQGGTSSGCGVPSSATAVAATVVAVDETGPGFLKAWPTGSSPSPSSFLNYANTNLVSTGVTLSVNSSVTMQAGVSGTDVVIDVQGYYIKPMYAVVSSGGSLLEGSRVTAVSQPFGTGLGYEVDFDRNVSACSYSVTSRFGAPGAIAEPRSTNVDGVYLEVYSGTTSVDNTFNLTVTC